jgi:hypothetical protein
VRETTQGRRPGDQEKNIGETPRDRSDVPSRKEEKSKENIEQKTKPATKPIKTKDEDAQG